MRRLDRGMVGVADSIALSTVRCGCIHCDERVILGDVLAREHDLELAHDDAHVVQFEQLNA